jgi:pimeloyl-ACP methyl ester carboxylesterase
MGERVTANGVDTYYERRGAGEPLLLMHGAFSSSQDLDGLTENLAAYFDVIAPDRRAHGRTPDVDGLLGYGVMADDTIAVMDALGIESAHVVGYSDGANVGLIMAIEHPERVRKLVSISGNFRPDGMPAEVRAYWRELQAADAPPLVSEAYAALSPDGIAHFPIVLEKTKAMFLNAEPRLAQEMLGKIAAPTLVVAADDDMISLDHTIELFRAISGTQLAIVPGASHLMPFEKPQQLLDLVTTFLRETESTKIAMF